MDQDLIDAALDREIEHALAVRPSPEFVARVRTRIAKEKEKEPERADWRLSWIFATASVALVAGMAVLAISHRPSRSGRADTPAILASRLPMDPVALLPAPLAPSRFVRAAAYSRTLALALAVTLCITALVRAQDKPRAPPLPAKASTAVTPLKVQVVISRYQGEKKISSMPYTLSLNAGPDGHSPNAGFDGHLRIGTQVPLISVADGKQSFQYRDVGTNIDCSALPLDDGGFRVQISIDDSSVSPAEDGHAQGSIDGTPSFRSFRATDSMVLKDGQTAQLTSAVDKVTGDVVKVDVTLTVVK